MVWGGCLFRVCESAYLLMVSFKARRYLSLTEMVSRGSFDPDRFHPKFLWKKWWPRLKESHLEDGALTSKMLTMICAATCCSPDVVGNEVKRRLHVEALQLRLKALKESQKQLGYDPGAVPEPVGIRLSVSIRICFHRLCWCPFSAPSKLF